MSRGNSGQMTRTCNGCRDMRPEAWPRDQIAARCMCPLPPVGSIEHYGRTMAVFNLGQIGIIQTPAWCQRRKEAKGDGEDDARRAPGEGSGVDR